ncbi:hypothetical protein [Azospirillum argentinense]|uniref:Lipoprotein n=1 Tax=Azospirillum argentinense TaxID=2970906 RepID=A0A5B0KYJ1_9PROT|nr:hypothetical protein [Azospirillum argentinense]KAA1056468.1 hypothetical protein FH063_004616 [Azospirillum argentinense]
MVRWGLLRGVMMSGLATLAASCQTTGYNTGERVQLDCERSPIQSGWSNVYTPTRTKCFRVTSESADLISVVHARSFEIPGGYANVLYQDTGHNTYIVQQSVRDVVRQHGEMFKGVSGWGEPRTENFAGKDYQMQDFALRGKSCTAFLLAGPVAAYFAGHRSRAFGYACANRLDRELVERLLTSFTYDVSRVENAPVKPLRLEKEKGA